MPHDKWCTDTHSPWNQIAQDALPLLEKYVEYVDGWAAPSYVGYVKHLIWVIRTKWLEEYTEEQNAKLTEKYKEDDVGGGTHDGTDPLDKPWLKMTIEETLQRLSEIPEWLDTVKILEMQQRVCEPRTYGQIPKEEYDLDELRTQLESLERDASATDEDGYTTNSHGWMSISKDRERAADAMEKERDEALSAKAILEAELDDLVSSGCISLIGETTRADNAEAELKHIKDWCCIQAKLIRNRCPWPDPRLVKADSYMDVVDEMTRRGGKRWVCH